MRDFCNTIQLNAHMQWGCELPMVYFDSDSIKAENHEAAAAFNQGEQMDVGPSQLQNQIDQPSSLADRSHDSRASHMHVLNEPFLMPRKPLGFKCEDCGRVFTYKSNMKKHREVHTDELPNFECWLCHKM